MDAYRLSPNEIQQRKANRKKYGTPSPVAASRSRTAASSAKENLGAPDFAADVSLAEQSLVDLSIETDADAGAKWTTTVTEAAHEAAALAADSPLNLAPRRVPAASASFAPAAPVDLGGTMDVHRYVRYLEKHQSDLAAGFAAEARIDAPASKPKPVAPKTKPVAPKAKPVAPKAKPVAVERPPFRVAGNPTLPDKEPMVAGAKRTPMDVKPVESACMELELKIGEFEASTGRNRGGKDRQPINRRQGLVAMTEALLSNMARLTEYLAETEAERKSEKSEFARVWEAIGAQKDDAAAMSQKLAAVERENVALKRELNEYKTNADARIERLQKENFALLNSRENQYLASTVDKLMGHPTTAGQDFNFLPAPGVRAIDAIVAHNLASGAATPAPANDLLPRSSAATYYGTHVARRPASVVVNRATVDVADYAVAEDVATESDGDEADLAGLAPPSVTVSHQAFESAAEDESESDGDGERESDAGAGVDEESMPVPRAGQPPKPANSCVAGIAFPVYARRMPTPLEPARRTPAGRLAQVAACEGDLAAARPTSSAEMLLGAPQVPRPAPHTRQPSVELTGVGEDSDMDELCQTFELPSPKTLARH